MFCYEYNKDRERSSLTVTSTCWDLSTVDIGLQMDFVQARPCAIVLLSPHWIIVCDIYKGEVLL